MASISTKPTGDRLIQFRLGDSRKTVRLGRCSMRQAEQVRGHIESLIAQATIGSVADGKTQQWLRDIADELHDRIARTGLTDPRQTYTVEAWCTRYLDKKRGAVKPQTMTQREISKRALINYFAGRDLRSVTPGDADEYEDHLIASGLAEATARKRLSDARQWFGAAVKHKLIDSNPFAGIKTTATATKHLRYISADVAAQVLEQMPNARMRLVFGLARWGGLRTPSEHAALLWSRVDLDRRRMQVYAPKTDSTREVPIFPELQRLFLDWYDLAPTGVDEVFPGMSRNSAALRNITERAIKRAGFDPWPRMYHNLRSSRQTELEQRHPSHVVCRLMGNSERTATKHYLQTIDADFDKALQIPTQPVLATGRQGQQKPPLTTPTGQKAGVKMTPTGFEPVLPG